MKEVRDQLVLFALCIADILLLAYALRHLWQWYIAGPFLIHALSVEGDIIAAIVLRIVMAFLDERKDNIITVLSNLICTLIGLGLGYGVHLVVR